MLPLKIGLFTGCDSPLWKVPAMESDQLTFRLAHSEDIPRIVALVNFAYRGESGKQGWTKEADLFAMFSLYVDAPCWRGLAVDFTRSGTRAACGINKHINTKPEHSGFVGGTTDRPGRNPRLI